jgi:hypothetical protein
MMYKTIGDVRQASLGPIIIMFVIAIIALMSIATMGPVWRFFDRLLRSYGSSTQATASMVRRGMLRFFGLDSENDSRCDPIDTRPDKPRRGGLAYPMSMDRRRAFRHAEDKTERFLQDGMRASNDLSPHGMRASNDLSPHAQTQQAKAPTPLNAR